MKQRLLSTLAMAAFFITAMAQTWTPSVPKSSELISSERDTVYLYNVGAAQFLSAGNAWGTHAVIAPTGLPIRLTSSTFENAGDEEPRIYWTIYFFEGSKSKQMLFNDNGSDCYVDLNNQDAAKAQWFFTKAGAYYRIQSIPSLDTFDDTLFFGHNPEREDKDQNGNVIEGSHTSVYADVNEDEGADVHLDWIIVAKADYDEWMAVNGRKQTLASLIEVAQEYGVSPANAIAVLESADATAEQVQAAIDGIKAEIINGLADIASEENPVDVTTLFVTNPDFDGKSTKGWTLTGAYAKTQNNNPHYIEVDDGYGNWSATDEVGLDTGGWLEFWKSGGIDADQDAHQVINDLPAGTYTLQLVGIGLGGQLYAITNGIEQTAPLSAHLEHVSFNFLHVGGDLTFGFKFSPTGTTAWVAVDKFRLKYLGLGDNPMLIILKNALNTIQPYYDQTADVEYGNALADEVTAAYQTAQKLIESGSTDEDAARAAIETINDVRTRIEAEAAAYQQMRQLIEETSQLDVMKYLALSQREGDAYEQLCTTLENLVAEFQEKYEGRLYDTAGIEADIEAYNNAIQEGLAAVKEDLRAMFEAAAAEGKPLDKPLDITSLFDNMSYEYGTSQVAFANGYPAENPVWMNETGTGNFKTNYSTAEVWDARPFNIYRDFQGLPRGRYTIQTHAFFRVEANDSNYPNWQADETYGHGMAYLYAGGNRTSLLNLSALACPEFENLDGPYDCGDGNFLPNNQHSAYMIFTEEQFAEQAEKTLVSASGNVLNDGDALRVGIAGTSDLQSNHWTIWQDFSLFYLGAVSPEDLNGDIQALIEQVTEANTCGVKEGNEKQAAALAAGNAALVSSDLDTKVEAMNQLNEVLEYVKVSDQLTIQITEVLQTYLDKDDELPSKPNDEYEEMLVAIDAAIINDEFESNAQLQGWIDELANGWIAHVLNMDILNEATLDTPIDLTLIIANATFDNSNKDGWTVEQEGNAGGDGSGCAEFWGATSFDIYQVLPTLREGYYRLSADAFYRFGGTASEVNALAADTISNPEYLYVNDKAINVMLWSNTDGGAFAATGEEDEIAPVDGTARYTVTPAEGEPYSFWSVNDKAGFVNMTLEDRYHNSIEFGYGMEGGFTGEVRFGLRKASKPSADNDWCPFDNFKLEYLGTTAPDAISDLTAGQRTAAATAIFAIDGRQQNALSRGINIVRRADGTVSKVLVK